ncbi:MAG: hypothetical protein WAN65_12115 [Candidatus Sulfotelmatobacter sp.]
MSKKPEEPATTFADASEKAKTLSGKRLLRIGGTSSRFFALMRRLRHVHSAGPYTRDEMNER